MQSVAVSEFQTSKILQNQFVEKHFYILTLMYIIFTTHKVN